MYGVSETGSWTLWRLVYNQRPAILRKCFALFVVAVWCFFKTFIVSKPPRTTYIAGSGMDEGTTHTHAHAHTTNTRARAHTPIRTHRHAHIYAQAETHTTQTPHTHTTHARTRTPKAPWMRHKLMI